MLPRRLAHVEAQQLAADDQVARHGQLPRRDSLAGEKRNRPLWSPPLYCLHMFKESFIDLQCCVLTCWCQHLVQSTIAARVYRHALVLFFGTSYSVGFLHDCLVILFLKFDATSLLALLRIYFSATVLSLLFYCVILLWLLWKHIDIKGLKCWYLCCRFQS